MGLFKLIIWIGIIYFGYKFIKNRIVPNISSDNRSYPPNNEIANLMVKDPMCEVYIPKRNSIYVKIDGEDFYFCSKECRNKFLASRLK